ncbi:unnamed protein product [Symbiodinium necroappetens]|uniref:PPM-type phosphatase domain-containing protein n=1 Tax=Symbiodinium necroappetens TaxID=1628268 RepID=A0A812PJ88_9DINO|nr:unnamed protein product [Symbiodinium necroappetens]
MRAHGLNADSVLDFTSFSQIVWNKFHEQDPLPTMLKTRVLAESGCGICAVPAKRRSCLSEKRRGVDGGCWDEGEVLGGLNDLLDYNHATGEFEYLSEDGSADAESGVCYGAALSRNIGTVQGVRSHTLRTRRMGRFCLADVTIVVDARISASAASMIAEAVHDQVIRDFHPIVTDVLVHVDPDGSPQSHRLETHSEVGNMADQMMMNPEELEAQIREALLQEDADKDLPRILEVKELQTYFYMEESQHHKYCAELGMTGPSVRLLGQAFGCFLFGLVKGADLQLGDVVESALRNNVVQSASSNDFAVAISQNKGQHRGEDVVVTPGSNGILRIALLMDGHGGQDIVRHAASLQEGLLKHCTDLQVWPGCAEDSVAAFQDQARQQHWRSGSTLVAVVSEVKTSRVAFAWAGDSMGVLIRGGHIVYRTTMHTLENDEELHRLQTHRPAYSYRLRDGYLCSSTPYAGCVMPTRGLGDVELESAGFLAVPETSDFMDVTADDIVLVASDGVWDVVDAEEAVEILADTQHPSREDQAATLAATALKGWRTRYGPNEADDVSVLLYQPVSTTTSSSLSGAAEL